MFLSKEDIHLHPPHPPNLNKTFANDNPNSKSSLCALPQSGSFTSFSFSEVYLGISSHLFSSSLSSHSCFFSWADQAHYGLIQRDLIGEVRVWKIRLVTNILWLRHQASVAPRWHPAWRNAVEAPRVFVPSILHVHVLLRRVTNHRVQHRSTAPPALLGTVRSLLSPRPVSHSVGINTLLSPSATYPAATARQHPSANLRDMKAGGFDLLFTNPHTTWYILSPPLLCVQRWRNPTGKQAN